MNKPKLAIVIPCFNEEEVIEETLKQLSSLMDSLVDERYISSHSLIICVNDGSKDNTWNIIQKHTKGNKYICGVNLSGNVGHQNALIAGLSVAKDISEVIVSIDADLQDDILVVKDMVQKYKNGCDIVYGVRKRRISDTWFKRSTALAFYNLMALLGVKSVYNHADYRLMSKRAVEQLLKYNERNIFLRGIVPLIGFKTSTVYYDRQERQAGVSKYSLGKMINFAIDGITSFSIQPLRLIFLMGVGFLLLTFIIGIYIIIAYTRGATVTGWTSLILSIWFIGSLVLISLGLIGEYIGKIYIETKARPRYNIESVLLPEIFPIKTVKTLETPSITS